MRFDRLDLNLLVALDALLTERSVSLAAERICLSQSATSSALGRLREYFGDQLLVIKGRQMVLTPRGEGLIEPVRAVLDQIRSTIAVAPPFDPKTTDRTIRIMASDYAIQVFLGEALAEITREAPNLRFELVPLQDELVEALDRGEIDLLFSLDHALSTEHPRRELYEDDYVVIGWLGNSALKEDLTVEQFLSMGQVAVEFGKARHRGFDENFLRRRSIERRVEVIVPSFLCIPPALVGSQRIALMQRRLASQGIRQWPLKLTESPIEVPRIREAVQWHRLSDSDPAIRWLVDRLHAYTARISPDLESANVVQLGAPRSEAARGGFQSSSARVSAHQSAM